MAWGPTDVGPQVRRRPRKSGRRSSSKVRLSQLATTHGVMAVTVARKKDEEPVGRLALPYHDNSRRDLVPLHPLGELSQRLAGQVREQPRRAPAAAVVAKVREIPRRTASTTEGYDGLGIIVISAINDGTTPVSVITAPPAPPRGDIFYYDNMITRVANEYDTTFKSI